MEFETSDASDKEILLEDSCMESKTSGEEAELFEESNAGESSSAEEELERKKKAKSKSSNPGSQASNGGSQKSLPGSSSGRNTSIKSTVVSEAVTTSGFFSGPDSVDANAAERIKSSTYSRQRKQVDRFIILPHIPTRKPRKGTSGKVDKIDGSESVQGEGEKDIVPRFELEEDDSFDEEPEVKPKNSKRKKADVDETSDEEYQTKAKKPKRKKPEPDERPKPKKPRAKPAKVAPALSETDSSAEAGEPDKRPKPKPKKPRAKPSNVAPAVPEIDSSVEAGELDKLQKPKPKKPRAKPTKAFIAPISETDSSAEAGEPDKLSKPKPKKPRAKSTKAAVPKVSAVVASESDSSADPIDVDGKKKWPSPLVVAKKSNPKRTPSPRTKAKQLARRVPTFNVKKKADPKTSPKKADPKTSPKKKVGPKTSPRKKANPKTSPKKKTDKGEKNGNAKSSSQNTKSGAGASEEPAEDVPEEMEFEDADEIEDLNVTIKKVVERIVSESDLSELKLNQVYEKVQLKLPDLNIDKDCRDLIKDIAMEKTDDILDEMGE